MTRTELLELIQHGENSGVEFKRDDLRAEQLAKEIVALANLRGGHVLLGVEDDGTLSGIQRPDLETWVMDTVFGRFVHPMILPFYEELTFDDGKRVAVISLDAGASKPYVLRSSGREEIYVRIGSVSRLATREQQARLHAAGGLLHAELLPVSGTRLESLSQDRLDGYFRHVIEEHDLPASPNAWQVHLRGLGLLADEALSTEACTIAGLLLFGHSPRRALPQAGVRLLAYAGDEPDYDALEDSVLDGPLLPVVGGSPAGAPMILEPGLLERLFERLTPLLSAEAPELEGGLRRVRHWDVPPEALREALVNAFAHRDWTRLPEIEVTVYRDRVEILSPGALTNSMTIDKMLAGQRSPRNTNLVGVLRDLKYADARGMGVRRKIVPLVTALAGEPPRFEATDDFVRVTLPRRLRPADGEEAS